MLRRIRRRIGWLVTRRRLFVSIFALISTLIFRRVNATILSAIGLAFQEPGRTNKVALSLLARDVHSGKDWERLTGDGNDREIHPSSFKTSKGTQLAKAGGMDETYLHLRSSTDKSVINVHIWRGLCCPKVNSLRQYPLFPTLPTQRLLRHTINSGPLGTWYGQRIMGYVHPPRTGYYVFHLDAHVFAELWLSKKQNTEDVELVAKVARETGKYPLTKPIGQTSKELYLEEGRKHFFDVLHVMNGGMMRRDHVNVTWKIPGSDKFIEISELFLSPLLNDKASYLIHELSKEESNLLWKARSVLDTEINDSDAGEDDEDYEGIEIPTRKNLLSDRFSFYFGEDFDMKNGYDGNTFEQLSDKSDELLSYLPTCSYKPAYATKQTLKRYEGVWKTHFSSVFPDDGTTEFICIGNKQKKDCKGNGYLTEPELLAVSQILMKEINEKHPG